MDFATYLDRWRELLGRATRPSVLYRPRLLADGDQWIAVYGPDQHAGLAGSGETPAEAMADFDRRWTTDATASRRCNCTTFVRHSPRCHRYGDGAVEGDAAPAIDALAIDALKPCPVCGGPATLWNYADELHTSVWCFNAHCAAHPYVAVRGWPDHRLRALAAWNGHADPEREAGA